MKAIYKNSAIPEREAKIHFHISESIMMENAAIGLQKIIENLHHEMGTELKVLIVCGNGNNGGDGYALARRLFGFIKVSVISIAEPKTFEAIQQKKMAESIGVEITNLAENSLVRLAGMIVSSANIIVDCIYGTGFHGKMPESSEKLIKLLNASSAIRIACDVPSGIDLDGNCSSVVFKADYTVTMGALKSLLFEDSVKDFVGEISVANLGISSQIFEKSTKPDAFLIEPKDIKLPLRKKKSVHKGYFGHTVVFAGEKSGAAIMASTAAMNFGSGLTSLLKTENSNLEQFKISPELMCTEKIPSKTTCIVLGSGLGEFTEKICNDFLTWFYETKTPSCVLDADIFNFSKLEEFLTKLNSVQNAKIVLTPHLKELECLLEKLSLNSPQELVSKFENIILVAKSANTKIYYQDKIFICADGSQNLSKGGSGDVLAGMIASLLSQKYSVLDACISAVETHALVSKNYGEEDYTFSPLKLTELIKMSSSNFLN